MCSAKAGLWSWNYEKDHKCYPCKCIKMLNLERLEEVFAGRVFLSFVNDGVWGEICEAVIRVIFVVK